MVDHVDLPCCTACILITDAGVTGVSLHEMEIRDWFLLLVSSIWSKLQGVFAMNCLNQAGCCWSHGFCHIASLYHSSQSGLVSGFSPMTWNFRLVPAFWVHITRLACSGMWSIKLAQSITWICDIAAWPFCFSQSSIERYFSPNTWNYRLFLVSWVFCVVHSTRLVCSEMESIKLVLLIVLFFLVHCEPLLTATSP